MREGWMDVVVPGYVTSKSDGDRHWVTGAELIRLYRLNPRTTYIWLDESTTAGVPPEQIHWFYPRYDGNYDQVADTVKP
jgi:hypothetical protein